MQYIYSCLTICCVGSHCHKDLLYRYYQYYSSYCLSSLSAITDLFHSLSILPLLSFIASLSTHTHPHSPLPCFYPFALIDRLPFVPFFPKNLDFFASVLSGKNDSVVKTVGWYCRVQFVFAGLLPS